jgi:hypothetical protein
MVQPTKKSQRLQQFKKGYDSIPVLGTEPQLLVFTQSVVCPQDFLNEFSVRIHTKVLRVNSILLDNYSLRPQIYRSLVYFLLKNDKYLEINI